MHITWVTDDTHQTSS